MQMLLSDDVQILFSTGVTVVTTNLQKADLDDIRKIGFVEKVKY